MRRSPQRFATSHQAVLWGGHDVAVQRQSRVSTSGQTFRTQRNRLAGAARLLHATSFQATDRPTMKIL
jgi:hypothetical protein